MVDELDIWRVANQLVQQHGELAWLEAAQRADRMIEKGDFEGEAVWRRVLKAIKQLQAVDPKPIVH